MAQSKFLDEKLFPQIDLDFFALWLPVEKLSFQGPLMNVTDTFPLFKIQDPVVKQWKFKTCLSFSPYIICIEDDENYSKRRSVVNYLNDNGISFLLEAELPGPLANWIEVCITMEAFEGGFVDALNYVMDQKLLKFSHIEKYLYGVYGKIRSPIPYWKKEDS